MAISEEDARGMDELVLAVDTPLLPAIAVAPRAPVRVYVPPLPPPPPLLPDNRPLRRERPQPERLDAIRAAPSPLIAAARPLLHVLANMPQAQGAEQIAAFHQQLQRELASFQSVCVEAHIHTSAITIGSYVLCAALDEAAGLTPWGAGDGLDAGPWASRQLANEFHGDTEGGVKVFKMLGSIYNFIPQRLEPASLIDMIELIGLVMSLGFQGVYRSSPNGWHMLEDLRRKLDTTVRAARNAASDQKALALHERESAALDRLRPIPYSFPDWVEPLLLALLQTSPLFLLLAAMVWYLFF